MRLIVIGTVKEPPVTSSATSGRSVAVESTFVPNATFAPVRSSSVMVTRASRPMAWRV